MRWKSRDVQTDARLHWHKWWAWHPVTIDGTRVWLESVYRKGIVKTGYGGPFIVWEYRLEGQL